jgi:glycerol-3-phosphate dehydrogenase
LPVPEAVALTEGRRLLFVIPWGERTIVGTTDTDYNGPLDDVRPLPEDINYLLGALNDFFPSAAIKGTHFVSAWAGLRPLIATPENLLSRWRGIFSGQSLANNGTPSDISRSHQILNPEVGWWDLIGGKLTTYRLMAEQALDQIVKWLGSVERLNVETRQCRTAEEPLLLPSETQGVSGILPPAFSRQIIEHYCNHEWAVHLDDLMVRRTMAACFNLTQEEKAAELENYRLLFRAAKA